MSKIEVEVRFVEEESIETFQVNEGIQIAELLEELERNSETVVVKKNGLVVPEEEELTKGDKLEVVPIVSGG